MTPEELVKAFQPIFSELQNLGKALEKASRIAWRDHQKFVNDVAKAFRNGR